MELRYITLVNEENEPLTDQHIKLGANSREVSANRGVLCKLNWTKSMTAESKFNVRNTRRDDASVCPVCLEKFKHSAHPEAAAYRKMFESEKS